MHKDKGNSTRACEGKGICNPKSLVSSALFPNQCCVMLINTEAMGGRNVGNKYVPIWKSAFMRIAASDWSSSKHVEGYRIHAWRHYELIRACPLHNFICTYPIQSLDLFFCSQRFVWLFLFVASFGVPLLKELVGSSLFI